MTNGMGTIKPAYTTSSGVTNEDNETITFRDGTDQWVSEIRSHLDDTRSVGMSSQMQLADFMARPINIATYVWDPANVSPFFQNFDPWNLYFGNKNIVNRINNFNLLQCKLHVKFMINGNSFYYGRLMVDYMINPINDSLSSRTGAILANIIQASQRLHLFIDPCCSQAGTLVLPFVNANNTLQIPTSGWSGVMGRINIRQMQALKHANGATTPVNITVFAWASDVKMSQPTSTSSSVLVPQAGDEYVSRPVSGMMSSVAKMAGRLESIPWIAPYAKATQLVSSGMGAMASLFGFSRPPQIENVTMVRRYVMSGLANTDRGDMVTKLTVDSKQELSVDPAIFGVDVEDELSIKHIAGVESYITQFAWPTASASGANLWSARVSPVHSGLDGQFTYNPAMTFAVTPFSYWRGTIRYRFQIVASSFHKGRLLISYDPYAITTVSPHLQYSKIIDLADERDFVIDVCWSQPKTFLPVPTLNAPWYGTTAYTSFSANHNGVLNVSILNELTSPNSSVNNDISINVFASAQDDFEVGQPFEDRFINSSYLPPAGVTPQAGDVDGSGPSDDTPEENAPIVTSAKECVGEPLKLDHTLDVFFGESISSFRQMLKRYMLHSVALSNPTTGSVQAINDYDFPCYRGYGPDARHTLTGPVNGAYVNTTLLNFLAPAFVGYRGSMRSKYLTLAGNNAQGMFASVAREPSISSYSLGTAAIPTTSQGNFAGAILSTIRSGFNGTEVTDVSIQPAVEVELPFYTNKRYFETRKLTSASFGDHAGLVHSYRVVLNAGATPATYVMRYVSVGEDFQLFMFQGQPPFIFSQTLTTV